MHSMRLVKTQTGYVGFIVQYHKRPQTQPEKKKISNANGIIKWNRKIILAEKVD